MRAPCRQRRSVRAERSPERPHPERGGPRCGARSPLPARKPGGRTYRFLSGRPSEKPVRQGPALHPVGLSADESPSPAPPRGERCAATRKTRARGRQRETARLPTRAPRRARAAAKVMRNFRHAPLPLRLVSTPSLLRRRSSVRSRTRPRTARSGTARARGADSRPQRSRAGLLIPPLGVPRG
jgi:hypothetical protein